MTPNIAGNFSSVVGDDGYSTLSDNSTAVYCQLTAKECVNMIDEWWVVFTTNE